MPDLLYLNLFCCCILFYVIFLFYFFFILTYSVLLAPNKRHTHGWLCVCLQPGTCVSPPGGRTRPPTCLVEGTSNLPLRTATKRRHETLAAAAWIHGDSENNPTPALDGMFDTLNKRCKLNTMEDYVLSNDKLKDKVVSSVYKGNVRSFENSPTNVKRSIATFYSTGLEIATHWLPMRPKIECWRLDFQNWSTAGNTRFVQ